MPISIRRSCLLLLGLPVAAISAPVAVVTHSIGTSSADNTILIALGLNSVTTTQPLPYELTLRSTFDPETNPSTSKEWAYNYGGKVAIDFRIGGQDYHYDGSANSSANRFPQSSEVDIYVHHIWFDTDGPPNANYTIHFYQNLAGLPGGVSGTGPLAPLDADASDGVYGSYNINAYPGNPNVPLSWTMGSFNANLSVQVAPCRSRQRLPC